MFSRRRKLFTGLVIAAASLLIVLGVLLSAPLWINANGVKREIAAFVHRTTGDTVALDRLELHFFPSIGVEVSRPRYVSAPLVELTAESAMVDLDTWSL